MHAVGSHTALPTHARGRHPREPGPARGGRPVTAGSRVTGASQSPHDGSGPESHDRAAGLPRCRHSPPMAGCAGEAVAVPDRPRDVGHHGGRIGDRLRRLSTRWSCTRTAFTSISPAEEVIFPGRWQQLRPPAASARLPPISPSVIEVPASPSEAAAQAAALVPPCAHTRQLRSCRGSGRATGARRGRRCRGRRAAPAGRAVRSRCVRQAPARRRRRASCPRLTPGL